MVQERDVCRGGRPCEPGTFEEAAECLGQHSPHSMATMAARIGRPEKYVQKALSRWDAAHPLRGDLIESLTANSADDPRDRNYVLVRYISRAVGGAFIPVPQVDVREDEFFGAVAALLQSVSDLTTSLKESLRDSQINAAEQTTMRERVRALQERAASIESLVDRRAKEHVEAGASRGHLQGVPRAAGISR